MYYVSDNAIGLDYKSDGYIWTAMVIANSHKFYRQNQEN